MAREKEKDKSTSFDPVQYPSILQWMRYEKADSYQLMAI